MLVAAKLLIALLPLRLWRLSLGRAAGGPSTEPAVADATRLAWHVGRAVQRLPIEAKCLPQAMALSWMLGRRHMAHSVVFGVRLPGRPPSDDNLHAWVEMDGRNLLGAQPDEWQEVLRLGGG